MKSINSACIHSSREGLTSRWPQWNKTQTWGRAGASQSGKEVDWQYSQKARRSISLPRRHTGCVLVPRVEKELWVWDVVKGLRVSHRHFCLLILQSFADFLTLRLQRSQVHWQCTKVADGILVMIFNYIFVILGIWMKFRLCDGFIRSISEKFTDWRKELKIGLWGGP